MMTEHDRIREALSFVPAHDREIWVRMGMAIKSELGEDGFELWDAWSQQADSYNSRDGRDVWKSIRANGKVTIATLFHEAKPNGYRNGTAIKPTAEELDARQRIGAERAAQDDAEIARERADAARNAGAIWKTATEARADHPYLSRKRVPTAATLREIDAATAAAILGYSPKSGGDGLAGRLLVAPVKVGDGLSTVNLSTATGARQHHPYGGSGPILQITHSKNRGSYFFCFCTFRDGGINRYFSGLAGSWGRFWKGFQQCHSRTTNRLSLFTWVGDPDGHYGRHRTVCAARRLHP